MSVVGNIVEGLISPVTGLISEFIEDKDKANELAFRVSTMAATQAHEQALGQLRVNEAEATTGSLFVGGWRPAVGWICATGMAVNFIITPLLGPLVLEYTPVTLVPLDVEQMMPVLLGMLGLGGMRSFEKKNGVARK